MLNEFNGYRKRSWLVWCKVYDFNNEVKRKQKDWEDFPDKCKLEEVCYDKKTDKQNTQLEKNCHTCLTRFKCIDPNKNGCVEWK